MVISQDNLPSLLIERIAKIYPEIERKKILLSFRKEHHGSGKSDLTTFRVNKLYEGHESVPSLLRKSGIPLNKSPDFIDAFSVTKEKKPRLLKHEAYKNGRIYVQNWSSMIPPLVLKPNQGEKVLDLSAAPGSKTCQMAGMMGNSGEIAAVDRDKVRLARLKKNLKQQNVQNTEVVHTDGRFFFRGKENSFDKALIDAPCSTEARIQVHKPETYYHWSLKYIRKNAALQRALLKSAIKSLKPGGEAVYSTCTFAPEENEMVVQSILDDPVLGPQISIIKINSGLPAGRAGLLSWNGVTFNSNMRNAIRIIPEPGFEGFFICKLRKSR